MKKLLIIILLAVGAVQAASVIVPKLRPAKEEFITQVEVKREAFPEVIVNGSSSGTGRYSTKFTVDINQFCPRDNPNYKEEQERFNFQDNAEGAVVFVKHCSRCNIGVYSQHDEESFRRCTYCGDKESN